MRKRYPAPFASEGRLAGWVTMSTPTGPGATLDEWTIVVPVKTLDRAKTRLIRALSPSGRRALVLAMASDVLATCARTPGVTRVLVATSDPEIAALVGRLDLELFAEPPEAVTGDPLNAALEAAIHGTTGPVGVVTADLPELRPAHLERVLGAAARHLHSTVPDHRASGTTMAFWTDPGAARVPRFGAGSAARFRSAGGAVSLADVDPGGATRRDVDTPEDLAALSGRPVGVATSAALREHAGPHSTPGPGVSATMVS